MKKYLVVFRDKESGWIDHTAWLSTHDGILWNKFGLTTIFDSYGSARNAINRTKSYAKKHKMIWFSAWWNAKILPVEAEPAKKSK